MRLSYSSHNWLTSKKQISFRFSGIRWGPNLALFIRQVPYRIFPVILRHVLVPETSSLLPVLSSSSLKWLQEIPIVRSGVSPCSAQLSWSPRGSQQTCGCVRPALGVLLTSPALFHTANQAASLHWLLHQNVKYLMWYNRSGQSSCLQHYIYLSAVCLSWGLDISVGRLR